MTPNQTIAQTNGQGQSADYAEWFVDLSAHYKTQNAWEDICRRANRIFGSLANNMSYAEQSKDMWAMYRAALSRTQDRGDKTNAELWVEAEHNIAVRNVVVDWYDAIKQGVAENRYPDPNSITTQERADWVLGELDADFTREVQRVVADAGTEFVARLSPSARIAMADEVLRDVGTWEEIKAEAERRLAAGEDMPPGDKRKGEEPQIEQAEWVRGWFD